MYSFRNILAEYLIKLNHLQIIAESIRQNISKNPYFQYQTAFQRIDKFHKGYLIPSDFTEFMIQNKIYPTQNELYIIFRSFDKSKLGTVLVDHFAQQILPHQNNKLKKQSLNRKYYPCHQKLQLDLQYLIARYFQHQIIQHNQLQQIRSKLRQINVYYTEQAFSLIDNQKNFYITVYDIDLYLRRSGKVLKPEELNRIFRILSCNHQLDKGLNICFQLFIDHLQPFLKGYYNAYQQRMLQKEQIYQCYLQQKLSLKYGMLQNQKRQMNSHFQI